MIDATPIVQTKQLRIVDCDEKQRRAIDGAIKLFRSSGARIELASDARQVFACVGGFSFPASLNLFPVAGFAGRDFSVAKFDGDGDQDIKLVAHELCHLLFQCGHTWAGIMAPLSEMWWFATGFSQETIEEIRR